MPIQICLENDLPSEFISSGQIKQLWIEELNSSTGLSSLHHLKEVHLFPAQFAKMNVAVDVQLFSIKTASVLEKAVMLKQLLSDALTTAWFIRLMVQWFNCKKPAKAV